MTEKREEEETQAVDNQGESGIQGESRGSEERPEMIEKPLEDMTKDELIQEVRRVQEESDKHYDVFLRSQAEIENLKKRNKKEKEEWVKFANESLIKDLIPVIDNLENAIAHSYNENPLNALREGVELTLKGFKDNLAKAGLAEVRAQGEPFDPCFHEAVSELDNEDVEAGIILKELQKGYTLHQRLIRPAMVVVSKGNPARTTDREKTPENECEER